MMSSSTSGVVGSDIDLVDQEIERHTAKIRELKSHRNLLVPISRLPPEILSKIFMLCVTSNDVTYVLPRYHWSWIKICQICSYWRNVSLECPSLWSCLDFSKPAWVPEMLARSKQAALTIKVINGHMNGKKTMDAINAALQHMCRVQELTLCIPAGDVQKTFSSVNQSAPLLHTLSLSSSCGERTVPLSQKFLNDDAPSLTHLELKDIHISWDSSLLKNLTFLRISHPSTTFSPSFEQLVEVLTRMPSLETLDLKGVLPTMGTLPSTEVVLSHLHNIRLEADVAVCANFLNFVSFPSTTKMHFVCMMPSDMNQSPLVKAVPIVSSLSKIRSRLSEGYIINTLSISCEGSGLGVVAGLSAAGTQIPSWLKIHLTFYIVVSKQKGEVAAKICEAISPLLHVRVLSVNAPHNFFSPKIFSKTLSSLARVQMLQLNDSCAFDVLKVLMLIRKNGDRVAVFPFLSVLSLTNVDFDEDRTEESELLDRLMDVLMLRYEAKAEVQRLLLKLCSRLAEEDVDLLEEICVDVKWDGVEMGFGDTEDEEEMDSEEMYSDEEFYYGSYGSMMVYGL